ncbi:DsrE family protein [Tropicimonas sp. TH_r6]|uniref:DsrE family protein n=1 Tax=Tropicimonas sp. TH_r6 TaxID=3082085 RepID=UPI00295504E8|nr:DsrE family protein [Tropicimonas sp. TH_r6]MDV7143794.1 DsrE family protein [Tropicimonas sp. TH_r6]
MSDFLIHITTGPEDPTKATLGCLVAATAAKAGHETRVFLAGDAVRLFDPEVAAVLTGLGTGRLSDHLEEIADHGGRFYLSGMSAKARGYDESLLDGRPAEFALPDVLVGLADEAATVLCY